MIDDYDIMGIDDYNAVSIDDCGKTAYIYPPEYAGGVFANVVMTIQVGDDVLRVYDITSRTRQREIIKAFMKSHK